MEPVMLALIAIGLLVILVFIIYLTDRVNNLERQTQDAISSLKEKNSSPFKGPFAGLSAKKLWDAMTGMVPEGMDPNLLQEVRERYASVLQKHIEAQFFEGAKDGERGLSGEPKNTRWVNTLRGQVESWMPQAQANAIYKAGLDSVNAQTPEQQIPVRAALDEACRSLYDKTQMEFPAGLSVQLIPPLGAPASEQGVSTEA